MAAAPVAVIVGLAVGAAVFAGPAAPSADPVEPCPRAERWEADAQALADELAGASDPGGEALRQELEEAGFAPGAPAPAAPGRPDPVATLVAELLAAVLAALDTDGDGELDVTVLGPDGTTPGSGPAAADRSCADPAPPAGADDGPGSRDERGTGEPPADPGPAGSDPEPADPGPAEQDRGGRPPAGRDSAEPERAEPEADDAEGPVPRG